MILPVSYIWCSIEETKIQPAMTILIGVLIIFKGNYNAHIKIKQKKKKIFRTPAQTRCGTRLNLQSEVYIVRK